MDHNSLGTPEIDLAKVWYLLTALTLGALASIASLLGSDKPLDIRVIVAYIIAGSIVSLGIVLLLVEQYGFSYFLVGTSIFAGYKAFDVLTLVSVGVSTLAKKYVMKTPPDTSNQNPK